jgi:prephenate dehydrogenase
VKVEVLVTDSQLGTIRQLTVYGFGLIGASVALAAKERWPDLEVTAIDRIEIIGGPSTQAIAQHLVRSDDAKGRGRAFAAADLSVLAAPLSAVEHILPEALSLCRLVTDCGSTKRSVMAAAANHHASARFVGGHPIAGKPTGGLAQAESQLFRDRPWIVCPAGSAPDAVAEVEQFIRGLGAVPARMEANDHDRVLALTSHVPQLLASTLLALADREAVAGFAKGPGFDSSTRVAGGSAEMWRDIFERNADHIAISLDQVITELANVAQALRAHPPQAEAALDLLARARKARGGH